MTPGIIDCEAVSAIRSQVAKTTADNKMDQRRSAMQDFEEFFTECDRAPRLNQLARFFAETASGRGGVPGRKPVADMRLLPPDNLLNRVVELHACRQGYFDQHYHSSIPYRLE